MDIGADGMPGAMNEIFSEAGLFYMSADRSIDFPSSDLTSRDFSIVDQQTGQIVLTKPIEQITSPLGKYQMLNFSEVREPGQRSLDVAIEVGPERMRSLQEALIDRYGRSVAEQFSSGNAIGVIKAAWRRTR